MTSVAEQKSNQQGSSQLVSVHWSRRALTPDKGTVDLPLPWTDGFHRRVRGRAGDLVVVQVKSANSLTASKRGALRTLGLNGIRSASLRFSYDPSTWGSVQAVREIVAVLELPSVYYISEHTPGKSHGQTSIESLQYGSSTSPAHLWRDGSGEYFGYESSKDITVAYWSSSLKLSDVIIAIKNSGLEVDDSKASFMSVLGNSMQGDTDKGGPAAKEDYDRPWDELVRTFGVVDSTVAIIRTQANLDVTWRAPYQRFEDRESVFAEVSCIAQPLDVLAVRALARFTGNESFIKDANPSLRTHAGGVRREIQL